MTTIRYTRYLHNTISKPAMLLSALVLCMLPVLAGCANTNNPAASGSSAGTTATSEAGTKSAAQKLTIMLDWYPNAVHSFLYAAEAEGYFAEEGLEVEIQMPADTNDALKLVAAGKVDLALSYQPQVLMARGSRFRSSRSLRWCATR